MRLTTEKKRGRQVWLLNQFTIKWFEQSVYWLFLNKKNLHIPTINRGNKRQTNMYVMGKDKSHFENPV